jgi:hypothetical protein
MSKPRIRINGTMPIELKKHFRNAVEFYANELMSPQLVRNLNIQLNYKRDLEHKVLGECEIIGDVMRPRRFKITITPMKNTFYNRAEIFNTLAHEMIHVKQYAYRQLRFTDSVEKTRWKGRSVNERNYRYENLPWEKEAFGGEDKLFLRYVCENAAYDYFFG